MANESETRVGSGIKDMSGSEGTIAFSSLAGLQITAAEEPGPRRRLRSLPQELFTEILEHLNAESLGSLRLALSSAEEQLAIQEVMYRSVRVFPGCPMLTVDGSTPDISQLEKEHELNTSPRFRAPSLEGKFKFTRILTIEIPKQATAIANRDRIMVQETTAFKYDPLRDIVGCHPRHLSFLGRWSRSMEYNPELHREMRSLALPIYGGSILASGLFPKVSTLVIGPELSKAVARTELRMLEPSLWNDPSRGLPSVCSSLPHLQHLVVDASSSAEDAVGAALDTGAGLAKRRQGLKTLSLKSDAWDLLAWRMSLEGATQSFVELHSSSKPNFIHALAAMCRLTDAPTLQLFSAPHEILCRTADGSAQVPAWFKVSPPLTIKDADRTWVVASTQAINLLNPQLTENDLSCLHFARNHL